MTDDDAYRGAQRMIGTWPHGPNMSAWKRTLTECERNIARTAMNQLEKEVERISIAAFWHTYNTASNKATATQANTDPDCQTCNNTGWQDAGTTPQDSTQVKPCHCHTGTSMKQTHQRIINANKPAHTPQDDLSDTTASPASADPTRIQTP